MAGKEQYVSVGGHRLRISNLDKVLYPETGTTKAEVLDYYARVATVLIPYARNRPATRKRWVHGVGTADDPGQMFFQKNLDDSTPDWVTRRTVKHSDHDNDYPLVNNIATLTWLAQIAALEIHVPQWRFGAPDAHGIAERKNPDRLVLDLDPGPGTGLAECAEVARLARSILTDMGLDPMPVTSGSKGIHLYAALDGSQSSENVSAVAHELARALEADHPDLIVSDMKKSLREGKVLVDWSQISANKTTITPYSLRGRSRPMVAAPRTWRELSSPTLDQLDFRQVLDRIDKRGDVLEPLRKGEAGSLDLGDADESVRDRLHTYRSMRDAAKTPEPVPAERPETSTGKSFVIQEHHARALHYDFRLEHDGVLVSWALPKGPPVDSGKNHLAVQTEDHPLEYGTFEGTIPKGEYGAGTVSIWDSGTFALHKWREGKEVIVTVQGEQRGTHTYALIHTGGSKGNQWLIHLMDHEPDYGEQSNATPATTAKKDTQATKATTSRPIPSPMLATLGAEDAFVAAHGRGASEQPPDESADHEPAADEWAYEMKWDGVRIIAAIESGDIRLRSRTGKDVTATYPELADLTKALRTDATGRVVLDGEVVALNAVGRPDFQALQPRMSLSNANEVAAARARTPVTFLVFDVLELDGKSVARRSYDERRKLLEAAVTPTGAIQVPAAFEGDLEAALDSSRQLGLEGVMAKLRGASYSAGKRTDAWVKLKHHRAQEVVVAGWRPGTGRRANRIGSLLLGVPDGDRLRYVGRVGTGFTEKQLDEILDQLAKTRRKTSPLVDVPAVDARDANWVRADRVAEVEFAEWTTTGRLRQPSWRGWRPDKTLDDVRVELA